MTSTPLTIKMRPPRDGNTEAHPQQSAEARPHVTGTSATPGPTRDEPAPATEETRDARVGAAYATPPRSAGRQRGAAATLVEKHRFAFVYGIIGLIAAALILLIGFWPVVLLAIFAAIGVAIGRYRDGDSAMRRTADSLASHFGK